MPLSVHPELPSGVVLCINENEDVLEYEKSFLKAFGYTVLTAPSGGNGLELASMHSVDVVIVDFPVPKINGQEVAIEMKRLRLLAPIILLTEAAHVPQRTSNLVDALIAMDHLASELLPAIAQLRGCECFPPPLYDA